jgi:hypothetical protein
MSEKIEYRKTPKVMVLATPEFYPNYEVAYQKLDTILEQIKKDNKNVMIMTDSTLKATKLLKKYIESRGFLYYLFVPNKLIKEYFWKRSYKSFINKSVSHLIVFYYGDPDEFEYAITAAKDKRIPMRLIDLKVYE